MYIQMKFWNVSMEDVTQLLSQQENDVNIVSQKKEISIVTNINKHLKQNQ